MTDPLQEFVARCVRIEPAIGEHVSIPIGGPVWQGCSPPEFAMHLRDARPSELSFQVGSRAAETLYGTTVWCGYATNNFGNFAAEYAPRLLASATVHPTAKFLFLLPPRYEPSDLKPWFWEILEWFGIEREHVVFCGRDPIVVDELHVFPQAEYMGRGGAPGEKYLNLLDRHARSRGIRFGGGGTVYASRAGLGHRAIGGERYLEEVLARAGVYTVRPETLAVREQLAQYARADTLIFAEGSAVHGRQLLGRRSGTEAVLVRRKGQLFCGRVLQPRCEDLRYLDALIASVFFSFDLKTGRPTPFNSFPLADGSRLVEEFGLLGEDLSLIWDDRVFRKCLEADLDNWAKVMLSQGPPDALVERIRLMEGSLFATGMQKYVDRLIGIANAYSTDGPDGG